MRAGGRIPLIIGRGLTSKARSALGLPPSTLFRHAKAVEQSDRGFSLAQKWWDALVVVMVFALVNIANPK